MAATITRDILESYLRCRTKGHLQLAGEHGQSAGYQLLLLESRGRVRQAATERLLARHNKGEVLRDVTVTLGLLKQGASLLLDATVEDEGLSVRFDALQRKAGVSRLGDFFYVPVLFHEGERAGRDQRSLLELLGLILATVQGKEPDWGVLIHGDGCDVRRVKLGTGVRRARRVLQEVRDMQGSGTPPRLILNAHCQVCEFRRRCHAEATAKDDLSLLRGMAEAEVLKYAKRGIFTVTQLSCIFRPPRREKRPEARKATHSHPLQALSVREKKVHVLGTPHLPESPARIYLDIEGDPERGFCYLLGVLVRAAEADEWHSFWADSAAEEPRLLGQLLDIVAGYPGAWLYAYGGYEAAFLRRVGKAAGREEEVERVLARTLNVLTVIHHHVYFPTYSNGLKDIAGYLGFRWTESEASGILNVGWRRRWEWTGDPGLKEKLTTYNREDCEALRRVTEFLYGICPGRPEGVSTQAPGDGEHPVALVEEMDAVSSRREWCRAEFAVPDFEFVNQRAYFDYQRDRVYVRTSAALRRAHRRDRGRQGKKNLPANRRVELTAEACPFCGSAELTRTPDWRLSRLAFDLRITRVGVRRWVTRYMTTYHSCRNCGKQFLPWNYLRLDPHCHALKCWAMNQHVVYRTTLPRLADMIQENFGLPVFRPDVLSFKQLLARHYEGTYKRLLERLVAGPLIHADETEVHIKHGSKGYVWVFTSLEEVVFLYRPSREGKFLTELLKGFRGVLVSDFYAAYDSLDCPQQKCLVHLIRDFNNDLQGNPWDEELKALASEFGGLLRAIMVTIDEKGLKRHHLEKHRRDVDRFFDSVAGRFFQSDVAEGYRKRLLKYRGKLFTFLDHDGVPWNNNNAEHAVKKFAAYREIADGLVTEAGLRQYLVLLSIWLTFKYRGANFLKFLLSRETDIDTFCQRPRRRRPMPTVELQPEGFTSPRRRRKQDY
jgi:predicted RecB family nuclease